MIARANKSTTIAKPIASAASPAPDRGLPVLFTDRRPQRPEGMENASCRKCRAPYTFWTHYQNQTELQCINCGHFLAAWVPRR